MFQLNDQTALEIVCRADVANVLGEHPLHVKKIAEKTGINADKLSRYLRALCNIHIFEEIEPQVFKNNELSALLKSEHKRAMVEFW